MLPAPMAAAWRRACSTCAALNSQAWNSPCGKAAALATSEVPQAQPSSRYVKRRSRRIGQAPPTAGHVVQPGRRQLEEEPVRIGRVRDVPLRPVRAHHHFPDSKRATRGDPGRPRESGPPGGEVRRGESEPGPGVCAARRAPREAELQDSAGPKMRLSTARRYSKTRSRSGRTSRRSTTHPPGTAYRTWSRASVRPARSSKRCSWTQSR